MGGVDDEIWRTVKVMTGDIRVIEDGADRQVRVRPPTPPWVWILVGLAIGVGFALIVVTPPSTTPAPEAVIDPAVELNPISNRGLSIGIADAVPEFPDALVAVAQAGRRSLQHLLWPVAGDPVTRPLPVGDFGDSEFDVTGTWLAVSTHVPDTDHQLLSMGKPASLRPLASDVGSLAWHDSESGFLAYTQFVDDVWQLRTSRSGREPEIVLSDIGSSGEIAAWGDWGWAIHDESEKITLLNSDGQVKTTSQGKILDSHPDGWILIYDDRVRLLSAGGGLQTVEVDPPIIGRVLGGAISPDGDSVALLGSIGLSVASIAGETPGLTVPFPIALSKVGWSSDSRFVVIPFLRGVVVVDVRTGETYEKLTEHTIVEASVIPLSR